MLFIFWKKILYLRPNIDELFFRNKNPNNNCNGMLFIAHNFTRHWKCSKIVNKHSRRMNEKTKEFCQVLSFLSLVRNITSRIEITTAILSTIWSLSSLADFIMIVHYFYYFLLYSVQNTSVQLLLIHQMNLYNCMRIHFKFRTV